MSIRFYSLAPGGGLMLPLAGFFFAVSCSNSPGSDARVDGGLYSGSPARCHDGTIQLLECVTDSTGTAPDRYTDEACQGLDTAESRAPVMHRGQDAPAIDAPSEGQVLPSAMPFTFRWQPTGFSLRLPAPLPHRLMNWRDELRRWTTLIPAAEAHCAPFSGVAFAVIFRSPSGQVLLRAETANRSYTPTTEAWMKLSATRETIGMTVQAARFNGNAVTEGPVDQTTPRYFTIAP